MFHKLKVKNIRSEAADCVSISLDVPKDMADKFHFKAGQYLTFRAFIDAEDVRRSYSICSSPLEKELRVAIKKVPMGKFSTFANDRLKEGDYLDIMPPAGRFVVQPKADNAKNYLAIAAGSGITPILSILKTVLSTEPNSQFTLIYGNKRRSSIIFKEAIEALKNKYMKRLSVHYILSQEVADADILRGRIDAEKLDYFFKHIVRPDTLDDVFICGPEKMTEIAKTQLAAFGVPQKKIHFELFTPPNNSLTSSGVADFRPQTNGFSGEEVSDVTVRLDGVAFNMKLAYDGENILDEAIKNGGDLPFACKGGVCCTCKAKLVEGKVEMRVNYGLEPEEIENGFILTCQAHPRTSKVVVDFDIK